MTASVYRHPKLIATVLAVVAACAIAWAAAFRPTAASGASVNQLESELGANSTQSHSLKQAIAALQAQVTKVNHQVALMQSRMAAAQSQLHADENQLQQAHTAVQAERSVIAGLQQRLASAENILAAEVVSRYEQPEPSLVEIVIDSKNYQQISDQVQYLKSANRSEQKIIADTKAAKQRATNAEQQLEKLQSTATKATESKKLQLDALAGMHALLASRQQALIHAQAAHAAALSAIQATGSKLTAALNQAEAQEAAAQTAASSSSSSSSSSGSGSTATNSGGWVIPTAIVMCESGGQNLPPNSAGASGYYQIIPSTWKAYGGTGPAAYLASKAEQDLVASRIYDGGKGVSNWDCAAIVGIT